MTETAEVAVVDTVRPDRTRRRFALGGVAGGEPGEPLTGAVAMSEPDGTDDGWSADAS